LSVIGTLNLETESVNQCEVRKGAIRVKRRYLCEKAL